MGGIPHSPSGQEPVGVPERPEDRPEVRGPDPEVVEHEHGGATLATEPPQESGEDLDHRKAPPIESGVQVTQQGTGDTVGASQSGRADRQDLRWGASGVGAQEVGGRPRGATGHGARPAARRSGHHDDPRRGGPGPGGVEPTNDLGDLDRSPGGDGREPVSGQHFGVACIEHRTTITPRYKNTDVTQ